MRLKALSTAVAAGLLCGSTHAAVISFRTVALSGVIAPDATGVPNSGGTLFGNGTSNAFSNLAINPAGAVAFQGQAGNRGIYSEGSAPLKLTAAQNGAVPDKTGMAIAGVTFTNVLTGPNLNAAGQTAFTGTLQGTGVVTTGATANSTAIFADTPGYLQMQVRRAESAPGASSGLIFNSVGGPPVINASGTIAFAAALGTASTANTSVQSEWLVNAGVLTKVAAGGDTAPGTDIGSGPATYSPGTGFAFSTPVLNANGAIAFSAGLTTGSNGVVTGNARGIWSTAGASGLHLVARGADVAPGSDNATFATSFSSVNMNNAGTVAFVNTLVTGSGSPAVTASTNSGVWKGSDTASLTLVARKGSQAAGLSAGALYNGFGAVVVNKSSYVGFQASLTGTGVTASTDDTALFAEGPGGVSLVARSGTLAPGGNGLFFRSLGGAAFQMNALGNLAFLDTLAATAGGATTQTGLFAQDPAGVLNLVVQTGTPFQIAPGDIRTISSIAYGSISNFSSGGEDGQVRAWTDSSTIAFTLLFTDNSSGVFTAAVPEPSALGVVATSVAMLRRRRRQC